MNHMTQSSHGFVSYSLCLSNKKIAIVDGTLVTVVGQGNVVINHNFIFKNVLHVPKLSTNLVSIHNLTNDLNYTVTFSSADKVEQSMNLSALLLQSSNLKPLPPSFHTLLKDSLYFPL